MNRFPALRLPTALLLAAAVAAPASHADTDLDALHARMQAMQDELDNLKNDSLDAARAQALADGERRVTSADAPLVSGHDGKNFVITDPAGDFKMNVYGQLQARYVANSADGSGNDADGFALRRAKLGVKGTVDEGEKFGYKLVLAVGADGGVTELEDFEISYALSDELSGTVGQAKLPFARQELISSSKQLGADRSFATEYFTLDRSQGLFLGYNPASQKHLALNFALTDGADNENTDFNATGSDESDLALTARADYTVFGNANDAGDVVAWSGKDDVLQVGAAVHVNFAQEVDNHYAVTADALYKTGKISALGAVYGLFTDDADDSTDFGVALEGGYNLDDKWQPFVRFDFANLDGAADDMVAFGAGVNYFVNKHNAKFTADASFVGDVPTSGRTSNTPGSGVGLNGSASDQVVVRAQFQLLF